MVRTLQRSILFLSIFISSFSLMAQNFDRPNGFAGQLLFIDHNSFEDDGTFDLVEMTTGFEFSYSRFLNRYISLRMPFKGGLLATGDQDFAKNRSFFGLDVTVQATYFGNEAPVAPFIYAGYGGTKEEGLDMYTQIPFGGGVNLRIGQWGFFQVKAEYRADLNNDLPRTNMQYGLGLVAVVGPTQTTKEIEKMLSDTDGDGVDDDMDRCPDIAGKKQFGGCLDSDNDGIGDADDSCPDVIGLKALNGCPDADSDGVADVVDNCPNTPGTADGCPDADNDGVADSKDKCPDLPGNAGWEGCPEDPTEVVSAEEMESEFNAGMEESNMDEMTEKGSANNVSDSATTTYSNTAPNSSTPNYNSSSTYNDYYPNSNALPVNAITLMEDATRTVQFRTLSDDLTGSSYDVLERVVDLMIANPQYRLTVSGHTDNRGEDSVNQRLSEKRARACIRFLRDRGVPEQQMSYMGYGARFPIAPNDTESGRSQNRRVDFELFMTN